MESTEIVRHRIDWIDSLKAIMIFFVLLGHTDGVGKALHHYIYSFHMEVFFFITGLIQKERNFELPYPSFLKKNFRSLMVPYFILGFATYIFWLIISSNFGDAAKLNIHPLKPFIGMFYGQPTNHFLVHNFALWFLPCLFVTHSIFYWFMRLESKKNIILLVLLSGVFGSLFSQFSLRLPWGIDRAFMYLVFYGFGYFSSRYFYLVRKISPIVTFFLIIIGLSLHLSLLSLAHNVNVYFSFLLYYIIGLIGILFWSLMATQLSTLSFLKVIGKNTMAIFILHDATFFFLTGIAVYILRIPLSFKDNSLTASIAYTIVSIIVLVPVSLLIKRYTPWILGLSHHVNVKN